MAKQSEVRAMLNRMNAPIIIIDISPGGELTLSMANKAAEEHYGETVDEHLARVKEQVTGPDDRGLFQDKQVIADCERCVAVKETFLGQTRYQRPDGRYCRERHSYVPIVDNAGEVQQIMITTIEVGELTEPQQQMKSFVDAIGTPCAIIDVRPNDHFSWWVINKAAETHFGLLHNEYSGRDMGDFQGMNEVQIEQRKRSMNNYKRCIVTKEPVFNDAKYKLSDGSTSRWGRNTFVPIFDSKQKVRRIMVTTVDITELKDAQENLAEAQQRAIASLQKADALKDSFMSTITHELLTPINGIQLSLSLLNTEVTAAGEDYLSMANTSNTHMLHLVESMITFTEARRGSLALHEKPFSIQSTLRNIFNYFESDNEKAINFEFGFDEDTIDWILSDEKKLSIVVVKLMENAVAYTPQGNVILNCRSVTQPQSDRCLVISVQDSGIGMTEEVQKNIFDAFSQADSSITRAHGGLGIGLTIVKDILNLMGGQLDVESNLGRGSIFTITVPVLLASEQQILEAQQLLTKQGKAASTKKFATFENAKILVVEDNPVNMSLLVKVLQKANYKTLSAVHGKEALSHLKMNADIAAILMDCQMPVMDGFEATRQIRRIEKYKDVPIIAVTANVSEEDQQKCLEAGMNDFLTKPADRMLIETTVAKWLNKKQ